MRTKLLLLLLFAGGMVSAQDTIRHLIITEIRMETPHTAYVEITNVGGTAVDLKDFTIGKLEAWNGQTVVDGVWNTKDALPDRNNWMKLPEKVLQAGESFVIAMVEDWGPEMWLIDPEDYEPRLTKKEMWSLADIKLHRRESSNNHPLDSVTPYYNMLECWGQGECYYLRQNFYDEDGLKIDSIMVDQVNGIWRGTGTGVRNTGRWPDGSYPPVDVAGFKEATRHATLIRKFSVKEGNLDFETGRGETASESEWIAIPHQVGNRATDDNIRRLFWTVKNHGDYKLTEDYLEPINSDLIEVNWADGRITVPWGVRRDDSIMFMFKQKPGIAWHYDYNKIFADSAKLGACTNDTLTVYVAGSEMYVKKFGIVVTPPTADTKLALPLRQPNDEGHYENVWGPVYSVTDGNEVDTIGTERFGGIFFGTRVDTLVKYLEIPPLANWSIVWVDGKKRTDLKNGDLFRVTAEDASTKDYFIKVNEYSKSHNALLNAVNWPDIPEVLHNTYGFLGDTIPNFSPAVLKYIVTIPSEVTEVPALVAHKQDYNSKVEVDRAVSLLGTRESRTVNFNVTAEDDTSKKTYSIQFEREIADTNKEIYSLEPFISEVVYKDQWANGFVEIVNPGTSDLDLSSYMLSWGYGGSAESNITKNSAAGDWANRYLKYIPGYKWVSEANWQIKPATVEADPAVIPIVKPLDVFVIGCINETVRFGGTIEGTYDPNNDPDGYGRAFYEKEISYDADTVMHWWASKQCDVDLGSFAKNPFRPNTPRNPWKEFTMPNWDGLNAWGGLCIYLYKITNDSVLNGKKPATDPRDFVLVDVFGKEDQNNIIGGTGINALTNYVRKPDITHGNTNAVESFGTSPADCEWTWSTDAMRTSQNVPYPYNRLNCTAGLGTHFMNPTTAFASKITSMYYRVSPGYGEDESISNVHTDMTIDSLVQYLVKADPGQTFVFTSKEGDTLKLGTDIINDSTLLSVTSANKVTQTFYTIRVGEPLSDDATLTSEVYDVAEEESTGTVSGIEVGTTVKEALENVTPAAGAIITVFDGEGTYIPLKSLTSDSNYVETLVSDDVYFEVVSESKFDTTLYKLELASDEASAFVVSNIYEVNPGLISKVPEGTTAAAFLANLVPCKGATIKVVDKLGYDRIWGNIVGDDILVVTSADSSLTNSYFINMLGNIPAAVYVTSTVYTVDQVALSIDAGLIDGVTVEDFIANLIGSAGSTFALVNSSHEPKTAGNIDLGDIIVVTGLNGTEKEYVIIGSTGIKNNEYGDLTVYPNPSKGRFYVTGLSAGQQIAVYNIVGSLVYQKKVVSTREEISMESFRSGIYTITIMDNNKVIGRSKLVKE